MACMQVGRAWVELTTHRLSGAVSVCLGAVLGLALQSSAGSGRRLLPEARVVPVEIYAHASTGLKTVHLELDDLEIELDGQVVEIEELCEPRNGSGEDGERPVPPLCRQQRGPLVLWVNEQDLGSGDSDELDWLAGYVDATPVDQPVGLVTYDGAAHFRHGLDKDRSTGTELLADIGRLDRTQARAAERHDAVGMADEGVREDPSARPGLLQELREQYVLGYYPTSNRNDGAWHRVRVKVRGTGVTARTHEGYYDR